MDVFYCLIHTPEAITPELCVLPGATEVEAVRGVNEVARDWPRLERIHLYRGNHEVRSFAPKDLPLGARWRRGPDAARMPAPCRRLKCQDMKSGAA